MEPPSSYGDAFTPELKKLLVDRLDATTEKAADNHSHADEFSTYNSFGNDCWQFREQALIAAALRNNSPFSARYNGKGALRCRAGEWEFGVYCVGRSANADIHASFPNPQNSAGEVGGGPFLPGEGMAPQHDHRARGAIVAYMASPEEGLGAVYLCIPRVDGAGNILDWLYAEQIWKRDEGPVVGPGTHVDGVPAETEERPLVKRRARGERRAG